MPCHVPDFCPYFWQFELRALPEFLSLALTLERAMVPYYGVPVLLLAKVQVDSLQLGHKCFKSVMACSMAEVFCAPMPECLAWCFL